MSTQSEFESLFNASVDKIDMSPGSIVNAKFIEIRNDYVLTAWSKGSDENRVFYKHVLRNALVPVVTMMGIEARLLFSGALLTETVFAWPGIGRLVYESILRRDQNIVLSVFVVISVIVYFANWLADITYSYLDTRIRKSS